MRRVLAPIIHRDSYDHSIEREIVGYFREAIFGPLLDLVESFGVVPDPEDQGKQNASTTAVERALRTGKLWYTGDVFSGELTAATSKELRALGAIWNRDERTFRLALEKMPIDLRSAIGAVSQRAGELHQNVKHQLTLIQKTVAIATTGILLYKAIDWITSDLERQFKASIKVLPDLDHPTVFTPGMRKQIADELQTGVDGYVKKFTVEDIPKILKKVEQNENEGMRVDKLAEIIEARFGIAKRKAEFLARQETGLVVSAYRSYRYRQIGSTRYVWQTQMDNRVRPTPDYPQGNHRILQGQIYFWGQPPIVNPSTGLRCEPGEDFNCRCYAIPILDTLD